MRPETFTVKVQEALERAQRVARERGQQSLEPEHVLQALLDDEQGVARALLEKLGADPATVARETAELVARRPRVSGGAGGDQLYLSNDLRKALEALPEARS